jgi:hypothetical protein
MLEVVRNNIGKGKRYMTDYTRRDDLKVFFARKTNSLFYTDATERNTIIFTDKLELKQFHVMQMMIPMYLPVLFRDSPLTEQETALLKSLGNKSAVDYEALIAEFVNDLDFRSETIRIKLDGFETAFERIRISEIRTEINGFQKDYDSYLIYLRDLTQRIQHSQYTLAGLESEIINRSGDSELMEYFMCNRNLLIMTVRNTSIEFVVHGYADIYDEEAFDKYVGNHNGYMYTRINSVIPKQQMERLYRAIFNTTTYKLRICAAFNADLRSGLKGLQHYTFPHESDTYLPNPHIQQFGCIGSYAGRFQEYIHKRDLVGAIDQASVSARNLNFYDSTVMSAFGEVLSYSAKRCIEKRDGTLLTPLEAITELLLNEGDE